MVFSFHSEKHPLTTSYLQVLAESSRGACRFSYIRLYIVNQALHVMQICPKLEVHCVCYVFPSFLFLPFCWHFSGIFVYDSVHMTSYGRHVEVLDRTVFGGRASTRIALGTTRSRAHGALAPKCWKYEISVHASHSSSRQSEVARHQGLWHNCGTKNEWSLMLHRRCVKQCWSYAI